jgi:hypothetical protein
MATLETQYKNYLDKNPLSEFTFDQWKKWHASMLVDAFDKMIKEQMEITDEEDQKNI